MDGWIRMRDTPAMICYFLKLRENLVINVLRKNEFVELNDKNLIIAPP